MTQGVSVGRQRVRAVASTRREAAQPDDPARVRTFRWGDPVEGATRGASMTGLAYLRAIVAGELPQPPIGEALDLRLSEVSEGRAVFTCTAAEIHYNIIGTVHGGLAATLIDSATGCAVYSALGAGDRWTTLSLSVDYLAALDRDAGPLACEARLVRLGRRVGIADATVRDAAGRVYARGSTTCLIIRK